MVVGRFKRIPVQMPPVTVVGEFVDVVGYLWELGSSFLNGFEINVSITRGQVDKATSALRYIIYFISAPL